jgi:hypothetical protein
LQSFLEQYILTLLRAEYSGTRGDEVSSKEAIGLHPGELVYLCKSLHIRTKKKATSNKYLNP